MARHLGAPLGAEVMASDRVRKELAGIGPTERWRGGGGTGPYTAEMTARTYDAMLERSAAALSGGRPVIADATFATRAVRAPFLELVRARRVPVVVVHLTAPPAVIRDRMAARARDPRSRAAASSLRKRPRVSERSDQGLWRSPNPRCNGYWTCSSRGGAPALRRRIKAIREVSPWRQSVIERTITL